MGEKRNETTVKETSFANDIENREEDDTGKGEETIQNPNFVGEAGRERGFNQGLTVAGREAVFVWRRRW